MVDGIGNGLLSVANLHIFTVRLRNPGFDIVDDRLRLLRPGIVGSNDRQIRHPSADLAHLVPPGFRPVAAAAEETDQSVRVVGAQRPQQAFQRHGIVGIIDHQGKFVGYLHHLRPPFHLRRRKRVLHRLPVHAEMPADGNRCECIVDVESARGSNLHGKLDQPFRRKAHSKAASLIQKSDILRPQIRRRIDPVSFKLAGTAFCDRLPVGIVPVHNPHPALSEQQALTLQVVVKIFMLIFPDMVRLQICKDSEIKDKSLRPVQHQPLRGNLHHHRITARIRHHPKIFLHQIRLGRGVFRMNMRLPDNDFYGADQPHLSACLLQNGLHQIGGGRFAFRSRDADDLHPLCRMPEICRRDKGKRVADIRHTNHRHIRSLRQFYLMFCQQGRRPVAHRVRSELVTVRLCTRYADKQTAFDHLSGIINNIRYISFHRTAHALVRYFL